MFPCNSLINFECGSNRTPTPGPVRKRERKREPRFTVGVVSRGDFNETIARMCMSLRSRLRSEVRLLRATWEPWRRWRRWRCRPDTRTVACRGQACTQFVSSSDNYAIMPGFLLLLASWSRARQSPSLQGLELGTNLPRLIRVVLVPCFFVFFFFFFFIFYLLHHSSSSTSLCSFYLFSYSFATFLTFVSRITKNDKASLEIYSFILQGLL